MAWTDLNFSKENEKNKGCDLLMQNGTNDHLNEVKLIQTLNKLTHFDSFGTKVRSSLKIECF